MTDQIIREFKRKLAAVTLVPSDRGKFEVSVDGELIFSKLAERRFPDFAEIQPQIASRLNA